MTVSGIIKTAHVRKWKISVFLLHFSNNHQQITNVKSRQRERTTHTGQANQQICTSSYGNECLSYIKSCCTSSIWPTYTAIQLVFVNYSKPISVYKLKGFEF